MLASETGVLDEPAENILRKGRLQPGKIFLVDLEQRPHRRGRGGQGGRSRPGSRTASGSSGASSTSATCPSAPPRVPRVEPLRSRQLAFGYTQEDLKVILAPLARNAEEAIGSMGNDLALAVLSDQRPLLYSLLQAALRPGHEPADRLDARGGRDERRDERRLRAQPARRVARARAPAADRRSRSSATSELESLRQVDSSVFKAHTIDITWPVAEGARRASSDGARAHLRARPTRRSPPASTSSSSRTATSAPSACRSRRCSPSRRCTTTSSARGRACRPGLVIESGEPREVHQFATLIGYGAAAINPYVMLETLGELVDEGWLPDGMTAERGAGAGDQGDRQGAAEDDLEDGDLDDLVLLRRADLRGGRPRAGAGRPPLHRHPLAHRRHRRGDPGARGARPARARLSRHSDGGLLPLGGVYAWRRDGEHHQWNPETIALLQHAVRHGGYASYEQYSQLVNDDAARKATLRGLLQLRFADEPIPLEQVEPAARDRQALLRPARCRSARSGARRTRRSRSR